MSELSDEDRRKLEERFEFEAFLGSGGFGDVFRTRDLRRSGAEVAVKVLTRLGPDALRQFKEEFRAVRDVVHDNLVTYHELASREGLWFITMDFIEGVDVAEYVVPGGREVLSSPGAGVESYRCDLTTMRVAEITREISDRQSSDGDAPPVRRDGEVELNLQAEGIPPEPDMERLRDVLVQVVRGLRALHDADKLHCDLKPSNVLVTEGGEVSILDFGLVRDVVLPAMRRENSSEAVHSSDESIFVGTPHYASPEQAVGTWLGPASDWYSLGVLLYWLLTGRYPIDGSSDAEVLARKQLFDPIDIRRLRGEVPGTIGRLCMDLLETEPRARPGAEEILRRLGASEAGAGGAELRSGETDDYFVGRAREFRSLSKAVEGAVDRERPALVRVSAPSGMGKTELCRHFLREVRREYESSVVFTAACHAEESVPYRALDGIVDRLVDWFERRESQLPEVPLGDLRQLAQLFPVVGRLLPGRGELERGGSDDRRTSVAEVHRRAVEGLDSILREMARDGPVVLFIDDIQWGDADSAQLLVELLSEPAPPVVVLSTSRAEADREGAFLETLRALEPRLDPAIRKRRLQLHPLAPREAEALAEALLGSEPGGDDRASRIARESQGEPFLIAEMARWLVDHAEAGLDTSGALSVDSIFEQRIGELDSGSRRLLEVLAVAGRPIPLEEAREVCELGSGSFQTATAELRAENLLRMSPGRSGGEGEMETYHDRVREVVLESLSEERLRGLHEAFFEALRDADAPPERMVDHLFGAGRREAAATHARDAAERARRAYAYDRAAELYGRAIEYRDWAPDQERTLFRRRGDVLSGIGRNSDAAGAFERARELAVSFDRVELSHRYGEELVRAGKLDEGIPVLMETLRELDVALPEPGSPLMLPRFMWERARLEWRGYDYELRPESELPEREYLTLEALGTLAGVVGAMDLSLSAYCSQVFCRLALDSGAPGAISAALALQSNQEMIREATRDRAREMLDEAKSLIEHSERGAELWPVYAFQVGMTHYYAGEFHEANEWYDRAIRWLPVESEGTYWERDTYRFFSIFPDHWLGRFDAFSSDLGDMLERARAVGNRFHESAILAWSYFDRLCEDSPEESLDVLQLADERWEAPNDHSVDMWILQGRVETHLYRGEFGRALELIQQRTGPLRRSLMLQVEVMLTSFEYLRGRTLLAVAAEADGLRRWWLLVQTRRCARRIEGVASEFLAAFAGPLRAQITHLQGDTDEAIGVLAETESLLESYEIQFYAAALRRRRGELLGGDAGRGLVAEADELIRECGVEAPAKLARVGNASVGDAAPSPDQLEER